MKKIIAFLLAMLLLSGCGAKGEVKTKYEIVVVPQAWSEAVNALIEETVKDRPMLNVYQNTSEEPDALYQTLLLEDLMAQEVDAVCIDPVDAALLAPMIETVQDAGVTVIVGEDIPQMIDQAAKALEQ